jgi:phosphoribosylformylglycinamidine synthase subunit PurQ / glutaminase
VSLPSRLRVAIIQFPGSNCDDDALHVLGKVMGTDASFVWHKDGSLPDATDVVVVPGGFSYGDYLRSGAIAAQSPIMDSVRTFAGVGKPVLGICNGFQVLCESGLLPGALARNATLKFECRDVFVRVEGMPTPFSSAIPAGRVLRMPIAHADGRYFHENVAALESASQVVFRYSDHAGGVTAESNPNGSLGGIAGVCNARGNVVGLMPHPERASESILGGVDGRQLFESLLMSFEKKAGGKQ